MKTPIIIYITASFALLFNGSCNPSRDDSFSLDKNIEVPSISIEAVPNDGNRFVIKDLSSNNFIGLWDLDKGGAPATSSKLIDTVFYSKAGEYTISYHISKSDGSGTAVASKKVTVLQNAAASCSPKLSLLTGECGPSGKCWTLSKKVEAVKVGPTYDDFSWFKSPVNGLQDAQYDDAFCFTFTDFVYENRNNGKSVTPWDGYKAIDYNGGLSKFEFLEGTGISNRDQIIIPNDQFMGVWDSDNIMDIVKLNEKELVVRTKLRAQNGIPAAEGWFELMYEAK